MLKLTANSEIRLLHSPMYMFHPCHSPSKCHPNVKCPYAMNTTSNIHYRSNVIKLHNTGTDYYDSRIQIHVTFPFVWPIDAPSLFHHYQNMFGKIFVLLSFSFVKNCVYHSLVQYSIYAQYCVCLT